MNGEAFAAYIREVLVPEIEHGTVVICDNLATHKNAAAAAAAALRAHELAPLSTGHLGITMEA